MEAELLFACVSFTGRYSKAPENLQIGWINLHYRYYS